MMQNCRTMLRVFTTTLADCFSSVLSAYLASSVSGFAFLLGHTRATFFPQKAMNFGFTVLGFVT
jgi:hypothetical protein